MKVINLLLLILCIGIFSLPLQGMEPKEDSIEDLWDDLHGDVVAEELGEKKEKRPREKIVIPPQAPISFAKALSICKSSADGLTECCFCKKSFKNIKNHLIGHKKEIEASAWTHVDPAECKDLHSHKRIKLTSAQSAPQLHKFIPFRPAPFDWLDSSDLSASIEKDFRLFTDIINKKGLATTEISQQTMQVLKKIQGVSQGFSRSAPDLSSKEFGLFSEFPLEKNDFFPIQITSATMQTATPKKESKFLIFTESPEYKACTWCHNVFVKKDLEKHEKKCRLNPLAPAQEKPKKS